MPHLLYPHFKGAYRFALVRNGQTDYVIIDLIDVRN